MVGIRNTLAVDNNRVRSMSYKVHMGCKVWGSNFLVHNMDLADSKDHSSCLHKNHNLH